MTPIVIGVMMRARLLAKLMMLPLMPISCFGAISLIATQLVEDMPCAKNENDSTAITRALDLAIRQQLPEQVAAERLGGDGKHGLRGRPEQQVVDHGLVLGMSAISTGRVNTTWK